MSCEAIDQRFCTSPHPMQLCHNLEEHGLHDMGAAMDTVEGVVLLLMENPALLRDPDFRVFTLQRWPYLTDFYQTVHRS